MIYCNFTITSHILVG